MCLPAQDTFFSLDPLFRRLGFFFLCEFGGQCIFRLGVALMPFFLNYYYAVLYCVDRLSPEDRVWRCHTADSDDTEKFLRQLLYVASNQKMIPRRAAVLIVEIEKANRMGAYCCSGNGSVRLIGTQLFHIFGAGRHANSIKPTLLPSQPFSPTYVHCSTTPSQFPCLLVVVVRAGFVSVSSLPPFFPFLVSGCSIC